MKVTVRLTEEKDVEKFLEFEAGTEGNRFDPAIADYPSLRTLVAEISEEPVLFLPFHPVFVLDSVGRKPGLSAREYDVALNAAYEHVVSLARQYGISEIHFQGDAPNLIRAAKRRGFLPQQGLSLRKKVNRCE